MDTLHERNILFLGGGHMAAGIIEGMLARDLIPAADIAVIARDRQKLDILQERTGVRAFTSDDPDIPRCDAVILAVPPQAAADALTANKKNIPEDALLISVCAGVTTASLEDMLSSFDAADSSDPAPVSTRRVVRVMPNTLGRTGFGYTALCAGKHATSDDIEFTEDIFSSLGSLIRIREDQFDAFTAFSCSGPAYVLQFIEAMTSAGMQAGFSEETARSFILENLPGTARLLTQSGETSSAVLDRMCTPGGVTKIAIRSLEEGGFSETLNEAVAAACRRASELGQR